MLKKLMKYEWKDTRAVGIACNIVILALTLIGIILFSLDIWGRSAQRSDTAAAVTQVTVSVYAMIFVWGFLAACLVVKYYFFYRYYKNLFTDQGYLMHTLPVKSTELLNAKLIVASIWQYITGLVVAISIIALICSISNSLGGLSFGSFWKELGRGLSEEVDWSVVAKALPAIISWILLTLTAPVGSMLLSYTAVCLGQTSKKHKLLLSVLILIGFFIVVQAVGSFASLPFSLMMESDLPTSAVINVLSVVCLLVYIGIAIGMYFLNKYFLERKLNLE